VIAELIEIAKDVVAEASRGARFDPPLASDELALYDAVSTKRWPFSVCPPTGRVSRVACP
jgi:hypothetical protein